MTFQTLRSVLGRRPWLVVGGWLVVAVSVGVFAPDLTRLAAEGQARLLGNDAESHRAAEVVRLAWPDEHYEALAVAALHRPGGLTTADHDYAARLARRFEQADRPREVARVIGPDSGAEIAARLTSKDGAITLVAVPLATPFVSPVTQQAVAWLEGAPRGDLAPPAGLAVSWTGDAVIGRDYMASVRTSLDRVAVATVVLLLTVLLFVYRSVWLALVPLVTIGVSLVISRGVLAWMTLAGWEISPLVELFLVAVLFGSGTDFCLFISWRFAENWDPDDPVAAMDATLRRSALALLTSAGTVIIGMLLMGTNRFKLFSSTGPSVALGLVLSLLATLTLTPALLVLLARYRPTSFRGLRSPASGLWQRVGAAAMRRPVLSWGLTLLVMAPLAAFSVRAHIVQDLLTELPAATPSKQAFRQISETFGPGMSAPLTVVLESDADLRSSEGMALIDDVSRYLERQKQTGEVRSATQPLGSSVLLGPARLAARFGAVNDGFGQLAAGASELKTGLRDGLTKLRAALWLEKRTGLHLTSPAAAPPEPPPADDGSAARTPLPAPRDALRLGLRRAGALVGTGLAGSWPRESAAAGEETGPATTPAKVDPREQMAAELARAADGAERIADGAERARREVSAILADPVGRRALDRLLINEETVKSHPELKRSLAAYITPDGRHARIDVTQMEPIFSAGAMDQVQTLRRRLAEFLDRADGPRVTAAIAGANSESADIRAMTRADLVQSWFVVPIGVFLVLLAALRCPKTCVNLVATMLLTYAFALGATYLVFVVGLGSEGIDWKVPYFLFVLLVAVGVDYNVFLMARLREETTALGLRPGIVQAIGQTGGLISSAAAITACSFASFLVSPLGSLRQLGFALLVGITVDALLVRPLLVPCGHWLLTRRRTDVDAEPDIESAPARPLPRFAPAAD